MFCTNCGKQLPDHIKFCTSCGIKIEQQPAVPAPAEIVSYDIPPKKKSKLPIILVILLAVILMGVCFFAVSRLVSELYLESADFSVENIDSDETENAYEEEPVEESDILPVETAAVETVDTTQPPETEPVVLTTADLVSHESISSLMDTAMLQREKADAKWDHEKEIPGECEYKGYVYMEAPEDSDNNKLYLVFRMNAVIKDVPIQFIYWVYFDDIAFDDQGAISYTDMGTSNNDGYTVKTAFGSYYSYYGLDDYDLFFEKIILKNGLEVVEENVGDVAIEHPVSDTFN